MSEQKFVYISCVSRVAIRISDPTVSVIIVYIDLYVIELIFHVDKLFFDFHNKI